MLYASGTSAICCNEGRKISAAESSWGIYRLALRNFTHILEFENTISKWIVCFFYVASALGIYEGPGSVKNAWAEAGGPHRRQLDLPGYAVPFPT